METSRKVNTMNKVFFYDGEYLRWNISAGRVAKGDKAGRVSYQRSIPVLVTRYQGKAYANHNIIWSLVNGPIPANRIVSHRDGNKLNNKLDNLYLKEEANYGTDWSWFYDYQDGVLVSKRTKKPVGSVTEKGYLRLRVKAGGFYAHRIIWEMFHGTIPLNKQVDHIDGDKLNNRIENLRLADNSQNQANTPVRKTNNTGIKGSFFVKKTGKYQSAITWQNTTYYLGNFDTAEEAGEAYRKKAEELHEDFVYQG